MSVTVVVGTQWGDEGKGKIVDFLSENADYVVRFQGGPNAGHTIVNEYGMFKLHGIPSGMFRRNTTNIIGAGCLVSPEGLIEEISRLHRKDAFKGKLMISERAHLIMPYHLSIEQAEERLLGKKRVGTTGKGIGPAYADAYGRWGITAGELAYPRWLENRLESIARRKNPFLLASGKPPLNVRDILESCRRWQEKLGEFIQDTRAILTGALAKGASILLEGQLGIGKCIHWGSYPYVTSSSPTAPMAALGTGIPATAITGIIGVVKAYSSSVGAGPMVTQDEEQVGPLLRKTGNEFGATTGRPRNCGWLDAVILKYAAQINGLTSIAVTRLDILDTFDEIGICIGYRYKNSILNDMPITPVLAECRPVYTFLPGWKRPTSACRTWESLPENARNYVRKIADIMNVPVGIVSVGPERHQTIVLS